MFYIRPLTVVLIMLLTRTESQVTFFPSDINMESFIETLKNIIQQLEVIIDTRRYILANVKKAIDHLGDGNDGGRDRQEDLNNPLNYFALVNRLATLDLDFIDNMSHRTSDDFLRHTYLPYPSEDDLMLTASTIDRIVLYYNLNVTQLANGLLRGNFSYSRDDYTEHFSPMTASDCFVLGQIVNKHIDVSRGIQWLIESLRKYDSEAHAFGIHRESILEALCGCYHKLGESENFIKWANILLNYNKKYITDDFLQILHEHEELLLTKPDKHENLQKEIPSDKLNLKKETLKCLSGLEKTFGTGEQNIPQTLYIKHCRGEMAVAPAISKRLKCWYSSGYHPFLRLARIKTEQLFIRPDIYLYHDVATNTETEILRRNAQPSFIGCRIDPPFCDVNETAIKCLATLRQRHCMSGKLAKDSVPENFYQRISDFTGLDPNPAHIYTVYYSFGGHFLTHSDAQRRGQYEEAMKKSTEYYDDFKKTECPKYTNEEEKMRALKQKDSIMDTFLYRVETLVTYLSEVLQGGATVFPLLGLTIFPKKGSALSWTTMYPFEASDVTCHAACPVLRGSKWVATKWMNYDGRELVRPCVDRHPQRTHLNLPAPVQQEALFSKS